MNGKSRRLTSNAHPSLSKRGGVMKIYISKKIQPQLELMAEINHVNRTAD